ncbi:Hypothetical protein, putative [Bodo saltans]|uniref:Uncharacterized protein n=1 Tax=Bodo saltans TaxID=75058 RepID=A0A0S4JQD6_BODSA|nr:Hypothetical protein, putative [Bodo saltans]|eukprot:CUG90723.1 Hypothetical protein, putative [Bodo saltans]
MPPKATNGTFLSSYAIRLQSKSKNFVARKSISETPADEEVVERPPPAATPQDFRVAPPVHGKKKEVVDPFMEDYLKKKEAQAEALKIKHKKEAAAQREKEQREAAAIEQRKKNKQIEDAAALEIAKQQLQERRARATSPVKVAAPPKESATHLTPSKPTKSAPATHAPRQEQHRTAASVGGSIGEPTSPMGAPKSSFDSPTKNPASLGAPLTSPEARPPAVEKYSTNPRTINSKAPPPKNGTVVAPTIFKFDSAAPQEALLVDVAHDIHNVMDLKDVVVKNKHENHFSPSQQTRSRFHHHDEQTTVHKSIGETVATRTREIHAAEAQKFEDARRRRLSAEAESKRRASSEGGIVGRRISEPSTIPSRRASSEKDVASRRKSSLPEASIITPPLVSEPPPPPLETLVKDSSLIKDPFEVSSFQPKRKNDTLNHSHKVNGSHKEAPALEQHTDESWMRRIAPSSYSQIKLVNAANARVAPSGKNHDTSHQRVEPRDDSMDSRSVVAFKTLPIGQPLGPSQSRAMQPGHVKQQINPNMRGTHCVPEGSFLVDATTRNRDRERDDSQTSRSDNFTTETMSQQEKKNLAPSGKNHDTSLQRVEPRDESMDSRSVVSFKTLPIGQPLGPSQSRAMQPGHVKQQINPNMRGTHCVPEGSFLVDATARNRDRERDESNMSRSDNFTTETMSQQDFNGTMATINPSTAHRVNSTVNLVKVLEDRQRAEADARSNARKNFHKNSAARLALAGMK